MVQFTRKLKRLSMNNLALSVKTDTDGGYT